ncbi:MAG: alpha/beta hydrolase [Bacillota bacterium]|nr:alpha/beta hydrolase [Bacillota bacterium]
MYENFKLAKTEYGTIEGYVWHVEHPNKVVCIVHGIGEYAGRYDRVAEKLTKKGYAVVSMDLRGHGRSEGPRGHCAPRDKVLGDVSILMDYARTRYPGIPVILYGHSMGGNIALDYRSRGEYCDIPEGYLITSPWITLTRAIPKPLHGLIKVASRIAPSLGIHSDVDEELLGNPEYVKPYNDNPLVFNKISLKCALDGFDTGLALKEGTLEDKGLTKDIPTLIMIGGRDKVCDPDGSREFYARIKKAGARARLIEWPELYHEIHNGGDDSTGDEVIDMIASFVKDPAMVDQAG